MAKVTQANPAFAPVTITLYTLAEVMAVVKALGRTSPHSNCDDAGLSFDTDVGFALGKSIQNLHFDLAMVAEAHGGRPC